MVERCLRTAEVVGSTPITSTGFVRLGYSFPQWLEKEYVMAYQPGAAPPPQEPGWTGYAAIKYVAIVIVVLAIIAFLVWALTNFIGD